MRARHLRPLEEATCLYETIQGYAGQDLPAEEREESYGKETVAEECPRCPLPTSALALSGSSLGAALAGLKWDGRSRARFEWRSVRNGKRKSEVV